MSFFPSLQTVTVTFHKMSGRELNEAILAATGHSIDPVGDGDVAGDESSGEMTLNVTACSLETDYQVVELAKFTTTGRGLARWVIAGFLKTLATEGKIPFGEYHIEYTWG